MNKTVEDELCGIERNPMSPAFGEQVVNEILLWNSAQRTKSIGMAYHGQKVEVIGSKRGSDDRMYYRVRVKTTGNEGWVSSPFLRMLGA